MTISPLSEKADMTNSNNVYLFKGSENKLEISQVYDIYFICQYDMRFESFDKELLVINNINSGGIHLTPSNVMLILS